MKFRDLGLTYEQALHGVQSGVAYEMNWPDRQSATEPKHLRTGLNSVMATNSAIAQLLIDKGILTKKEYAETVRLAMNEELASYEAKYPRMKFR